MTLVRGVLLGEGVLRVLHSTIEERVRKTLQLYEGLLQRHQAFADNVGHACYPLVAELLCHDADKLSFRIMLQAKLGIDRTWQWATLFACNHAELHEACPWCATVQNFPNLAVTFQNQGTLRTVAICSLAISSVRHAARRR